MRRVGPRHPGCTSCPIGGRRRGACGSAIQERGRSKRISPRRWPKTSRFTSMRKVSFVLNSDITLSI